MGVESLPVMTCGEVQQKECLTHKYRKYVKDQKMCLLWQGFHHKQRNAEVLLKGMCRTSEGNQEKETTGFPSGCRAGDGTPAAGVFDFFQSSHPFRLHPSVCL